MFLKTMHLIPRSNNVLFAISITATWEKLAHFNVFLNIYQIVLEEKPVAIET
jgi:hypothetical protein